MTKKLKGPDIHINRAAKGKNKAKQSMLPSIQMQTIFLHNSMHSGDHHQRTALRTQNQTLLSK